MTDNKADLPWQARNQSSTVSTQRDILEQILLHYPKRIARWLAQHCPERLLPNKEAAGVLDALEGWGEEPVTWSGTYFQGLRPYIITNAPYGTYVTHSHGGNNGAGSNTPSK